MKLSNVFATSCYFFFFLSQQGAAVEKSFSLSTNPTCVEFNEFNLKGRSEFVDTDNSGIPPTFGAPLITTGDMQIAAYDGKFTLNGGYSGSRYRIQKFELQSVCTTLEDQSPPSAPECRVEIWLKFCRKLSIVATPIDIKDTFLRRKLQDRKGEFLSEQDFDALIDPDDPQVDADTFRQLDPDLQKKLKFCYGTREGNLTAVGTGPSKYAITGGTSGFFGAFGQIDFELVPNFFDLNYDGTTGDVNLELRDTQLQFCYENACGSGSSKFTC